jgi:hypothetical protein
MAKARRRRHVTITELNGSRIFAAPAEGPLLGSEQDALDLIGEVYEAEVTLIAVPASRLHPDFLRLRTGMAGAFLQKMQNYGCRFAVVGDVSDAIAGSSALRDFVHESNRIGRMLFVADWDELARRI